MNSRLRPDPTPPPDTPMVLMGAYLCPAATSQMIGVNASGEFLPFCCFDDLRQASQDEIKALVKQA